MYNKNGSISQADSTQALAFRPFGSIQWENTIGGAMTLHGSVLVWGGTVMIALFALAFLFLIHGQRLAAITLFLGANVLGVLVWFLAASFRRAHPPQEEAEESASPLSDRLDEPD